MTNTPRLPWRAVPLLLVACGPVPTDGTGPGGSGGGAGSGQVDADACGNIRINEGGHKLYAFLDATRRLDAEITSLWNAAKSTCVACEGVCRASAEIGGACNARSRG